MLVVWKLDRLGRNLAHLVNTVQDLSARGVGLRCSPAQRWWTGAVGGTRLVRNGSRTTTGRYASSERKAVTDESATVRNKRGAQPKTDAESCQGPFP